MGDKEKTTKIRLGRWQRNYKKGWLKITSTKVPRKLWQKTKKRAQKAPKKKIEKSKRWLKKNEKGDVKGCQKNEQKKGFYSLSLNRTKATERLEPKKQLKKTTK